MSSQETIAPPENLTPEHKLDQFDSGEPVLDHWLQKRAQRNEETGASRTYVVCIKKRVIGYYALAVGAIEATKALGKVKRNMPDPIPVMVLGRLAVDQNYQGMGIGRGLLRDAILRVVQASDIAGIKAILVHAISEDAKTFYQRCGFRPSPIEPMTLMITVADAIKELTEDKPH